MMKYMKTFYFYYLFIIFKSKINRLYYNKVFNSYIIYYLKCLLNLNAKIFQFSYLIHKIYKLIIYTKSTIHLIIYFNNKYIILSKTINFEKIPTFNKNKSH